MKLKNIHHIALIVSNYKESKLFYTEILGLEILKETYRTERESYKLDLALNDNYCIELFSFPNYVQRPTRPEALGLRHLAFAVDNIEDWRHRLTEYAIPIEEIREDKMTGKRFFFFADPDGLPIELYES